MAKRKNVLLILSDQQRMDTISAYGMNDICKTPHIDQLAAEGMKFSNAYTPSAICAPARASVMTGLYPHKHGVVDNFTNIKEGTPLLGDCMHDAGYFCGYAGKCPLWATAFLAVWCFPAWYSTRRPTTSRTTMSCT